MLSCYCAVYGRIELLGEAIESFHRQDYEGEKELVILNDHPAQTIQYEHPEVTVINIGRRFHSLGEKWNALISLCRGDILTPWDDDDIHMPWFLRVYRDWMDGAEYFRPVGSWYMERDKQPLLAFNAPYHSQCMFTRRCFDLVQGYPIGRHVPEDTTFEQMRTMRNVPSVNRIVPVTDYGYIYRWRWMWNNSDGWTGDPAAIDGRQQVREGTFDIEPRWAQDYESLIVQQWAQPFCIDPHGLIGQPENRGVLLGKGRHCRREQSVGTAPVNGELSPQAVA